jgi:hypothetical protein
LASPITVFNYSRNKGSITFEFVYPFTSRPSDRAFGKTGVFDEFRLWEGLSTAIEELPCLLQILATRIERRD